MGLTTTALVMNSTPPTSAPGMQIQTGDNYGDPNNITQLVHNRVAMSTMMQIAMMGMGSISATQEWFLDSDGDGFGDVNQSVMDCAQPSTYVDNFADCDDNAQGTMCDWTVQTRCL